MAFSNRCLGAPKKLYHIIFHNLHFLNFSFLGILHINDSSMPALGNEVNNGIRNNIQVHGLDY